MRNALKQGNKISVIKLSAEALFTMSELLLDWLNEYIHVNRWHMESDKYWLINNKWQMTHYRWQMIDDRRTLIWPMTYSWAWVQTMSRSSHTQFHFKSHTHIWLSLFFYETICQYYLSLAIHHPTSVIYHSPPVTCPKSSVIYHPSPVTHPPSSVIRHPSSVICDILTIHIIWAYPWFNLLNLDLKIFILLQFTSKRLWMTGDRWHQMTVLPLCSFLKISTHEWCSPAKIDAKLCKFTKIFWS